MDYSMKIEIGNREIHLVKGDITRQSTDTIVNAANSSLMGGSGVDGAIHRAGGPAILRECKQIIQQQGRLPTGQAVITIGGKLRTRYVIHTVGPVWYGGNKNEAALLASAYRESLKLADRKHLSSISFPSISTGAYGYPVYEAAKIAIKSVVSFLREEASFINEVAFVLHDDRTYNAYQAVLSKLQF
jgi:O-acetyl-ADP-ribose deacetylase (regulator of RNase III)